MAVKQKRVRKILTKKIHALYDIIADVDELLTDMETDFYRVCIFGSARIDKDSPFYQQVEELARKLAEAGVDVVTGGGPGLMEAANKGSQYGGRGTRSIGLPIDLPFEADANSHLDVKSQHKRFSSRLDEFMRVSHAVVVTPGGIGTLLELFYTWQLLQVKHIRSRPVLLLGPPDMWSSLLKWVETWPLAHDLISAKDLAALKIVNNVDEVLDELSPSIERFQKTSKKKPKTPLQ